MCLLDKAAQISKLLFSCHYRYINIFLLNACMHDEWMVMKWERKKGDEQERERERQHHFHEFSILVPIILWAKWKSVRFKTTFPSTFEKHLNGNFRTGFDRQSDIENQTWFHPPAGQNAIRCHSTWRSCAQGKNWKKSTVQFSFLSDSIHLLSIL